MTLPLKQKSPLAAKNPHRQRGHGIDVDGPLFARMGRSLAYAERLEDFLLPSGGTLPGDLATAATGANAVAGAYVDGADGGIYRLTTTTDNEAQTNLLTGHASTGVKAFYDIAKIKLFECRVKLTMDATGTSGVLGTGDNLVIGLAAAHNATLDSNTLNAWFRSIGDADNLNLLWESDDGTTDDDDNDTGVDMVDASWMWLAIDFSGGLSNVRFLVSVTNSATPTYTQVGKANMAAASGNVQPYFYLTKGAAANNDHTLDIDAFRIVYGR